MSIEKNKKITGRKTVPQERIDTSPKTPSEEKGIIMGIRKKIKPYLAAFALTQALQVGIPALQTKGEAAEIDKDLGNVVGKYLRVANSDYASTKLKKYLNDVKIKLDEEKLSNKKETQLLANMTLLENAIEQLKTSKEKDKEQKELKRTDKSWVTSIRYFKRNFEKGSRLNMKVIKNTVKNHEKYDEVFSLTADELIQWEDIMETHNMIYDQIDQNKILIKGKLFKALNNFPFEKYHTYKEVLEALQTDPVLKFLYKKAKWGNIRAFANRLDIKEDTKWDLKKSWWNSQKPTGPKKTEVNKTAMMNWLRDQSKEKIAGYNEKSGEYDEGKVKLVILQSLLDEYEVSQDNWNRVMDSSVGDFVSERVEDTEWFGNKNEYKKFATRLKYNGGNNNMDMKVGDFMWNAISQGRYHR